MTTQWYELTIIRPNGERDYMGAVSQQSVDWYVQRGHQVEIHEITLASPQAPPPAEAGAR